MEEQNQTPAAKSHSSDYVDLDGYTTGCEVALTNAADAEVAPLLAARGYAAATITAKQNRTN